MTETDRVIANLLDLRRKDQERRLLAVQTELKILRHKLDELEAEAVKLDANCDEFGQMSVENGYLRYLNHRRSVILEQIEALKEQSDALQINLKKSVYSQSVIDETLGT